MSASYRSIDLSYFFINEDSFEKDIVSFFKKEDKVKLYDSDVKFNKYWMKMN